MQQVIFVLNSGSSSLKFALFAMVDQQLISPAIYRGEISDIAASAKLTVKNAEQVKIVEQTNLLLPTDNAQQAALVFLLQWINTNLKDVIVVAVGHRVVHGGTSFLHPVVINDEVVQTLESYNVLAPLHQPYNIAGIHALAKVYPDVMQVACFDTMFHATQPEVAQAFALPNHISPVPIKRYGFHGLSYEYIAHVLPEYLGDSETNKKIIIAHLGHGASLCVLHNRISMATTMGFSALDGLMMATRCGSLDPGVVLYLLTQQKMSVAALTQLLYEQSGLLGVSGISSDVRNLLQSQQEQAQKAIKLFVYRIIKEMGGLIAVIGGIDHIIFTAGIGEHSPEIRSLVCDQLEWLGLKLDSRANYQNKGKISASNSVISVWVIPTNEELMIARHTWRLKFC